MMFTLRKALSVSVVALLAAGSALGTPNPPDAYVKGSSVNTFTVESDAGGEFITTFVFDGELFASNLDNTEAGLSNPVGTYSGTCVTTKLDATQNYYCQITDKYPEGEISVQGSGVLDGSPGVFGIVGGTDAYKNTKGTLSVTTLSLEVFGHEYDFNFNEE